MPFRNRAAYLMKTRARPLEVRDAPYTQPKANEIVLASRAVAINPVDRTKQEIGDFLLQWMKYPIVLGYDIAGQVVEVGASVTRFKVGDRVVGHALGLDEKFNNNAECSFQDYVVLQEYMAAPIPASVDYEKAAVLPLALSTAACGLFQKDQLGLQHPTSPPQQSTDKTLLVWGAGTSVGMNAVQLAVCAGYTVFATCSSRSFDLVKSLGAEQVFDYRSTTVVSDITAAYSNRETAGVISVGQQGAAEKCMDIIAKCKGDRILSFASYPMPETFSVPLVLWTFGRFMVKKWVKSTLGGFKVQPLIFGSTLGSNEVGPAVYRDFLGKALEAGTYKCAPEPYIVGKGLDQIQKAIDMQREIGTMGKKAVVKLG